MSLRRCILLLCFVLSSCSTPRGGVEEPSFVVPSKAERDRLEQRWVRDKTWRYTEYYPDQETLLEGYRIMEKRGFPSSEISEILFYRLEGGRHVLGFETHESDLGARYHAIGYDRKGRIEVVWIQWQPDRQTTILEKLEVPADPKR